MAVVLMRRARLGTVMALALIGCSGEPRSARSTGDSTALHRTTRGPDPLMLRVPIGGGTARVVAYPSVDSTIWTSDAVVPALDRILEFDNNEGLIAFVDARGRPGRLDLNASEVSVASSDRLTSVASVSGAAIFGVAGNGSVERLTTSGNWTYTPPRPARAVFPERDGSMLVLGGRGPTSTLWHVRPPTAVVLDSVRVPNVGQALATSIGDRLYFTSGRDLLPIETPTLVAAPAVPRIGHVAALAVTPSGDRVFVASDSERTVRVIDRYRGRVAATLTLPRPPLDLRVDPLGRFLLVRDGATDSVWVVAIGNDRVVATVASRWRGDLPLVAPDGAIITLRGSDVTIIDPVTFQPRDREVGGGNDFWFAFWWSGFRPRAQAVADSMMFTTPDTSDHASPALGAADSEVVTPSRMDSVVPVPVGFSVQFYWGLSEQTARDSAAAIHIGNGLGRVETTFQLGRPVYHVVVGPYPTREEAERVGKASGAQYCITDGVTCR